MNFSIAAPPTNLPGMKAFHEVRLQLLQVDLLSECGRPYLGDLQSFYYLSMLIAHQLRADLDS
jgi:hypothetical protein